MRKYYSFKYYAFRKIKRTEGLYYKGNKGNLK